MVAVAVVEDPSPGSTFARLEAMRDELAAIAVGPSGADDAGDVDLLAAAERLASAVVAVQAALVVRFARRQAALSVERAERIRGEVDPRTVHASIVDQVALACRFSPTEAARRLSTARALTADLPETFALLRTGSISGRVAESVIAATRHLDPAGRAAVDREVAQRRIDTMGPRAAAAMAMRCAYAHDPAGFVARGRHARGDRRVGLRPAPDTMAVLTGYLPVEQGVACLAALRRRTDALKAGGDARSRDQIMADTLVERVTGQVAAADIDVEVQILIPVETLAGTSDRPPVISGVGPIPAGTAWDVLSTGTGRRWWRRLFTATEPEEARRTIVGGDRRRRLFDEHVRRLVTARDQTCRAPFCGAPIRHVDHVRAWSRGGSTTLDNAQGLCERHNQTKEHAGWQVAGPDATRTLVRTPTGHHYLSRAPDPP